MTSFWMFRFVGRIAWFLVVVVAIGTEVEGQEKPGDTLAAGAARIDITRAGVESKRSPLFVKALAISDESSGKDVMVITVDAVAIAEIGSIRDPYLANVKRRLQEEFGIDPGAVLVNASHCHGIVCEDIEDRTVEAARRAWEGRIPVRVSAGTGREDRISENRRLILKDGSVADVRHAYALPADDRIADVGPIDPEIGILRLDRVEDGKPVALIYQFACHPIQGVPGGGNTSDLSGFASQVIEDQLGHGAIALFLQGCGGDINPANYKVVDQPRDAEPLGNRLALSTLAGARTLSPQPGASLGVVGRTLKLPRADHSRRIEEMKREIDTLVETLKGTSLDLDTFLPLYVKYHLSRTEESPSNYRQRYLQDEELGIDDWKHLDEVNRKNLDAYVANIRIMEELTRKQINLALLEKHQARNEAAGSRTVEAEVMGLRLGDFRLVTFPAELTVPIGLGLKARSPHELTFVSGYTNGYLYYAPTAAQWKNSGGAQEDSDCLLAPEWQSIFEEAALEILRDL